MKLFAGNNDTLARLREHMDAIPVDQCFKAPDDWRPQNVETTIEKPVDVTGPATYIKGKWRTLHFIPATQGGWRFVRTDFPEQLPVRVAAENVLSSRRNIVLHSGCPANQIRMTEHIIAHRLGLELDHLIIATDSDDPPLFDVGSMPIVEALQNAGTKRIENRTLTYHTVKEPAAIISPNDDGFLLFLPDEGNSAKLSLDVAIDFPTAIGKQRIQFDLTPEAFIHGAHARTNCSLAQMRFVRYLGWLNEATRHFAYTKDNILIAAKDRYVNTPALIHNGKSLEAVWHRACLDLIAALSLLPDGRLAGHVISYKAGHTLDCRFMTLLERHHLLV